MKKEYTVERRSSGFAVYDPDGHKVNSFIDYQTAKKESDKLNNNLLKESKNE